jgi:hypothetical protein
MEFLIDQEEIKIQPLPDGKIDPNKVIINGQEIEIAHLNLKDLKEAQRMSILKY